MVAKRYIYLFTDFGLAGPYTGQMISSIKACSPASEIISLQADAPCTNPRAASYLLAALLKQLPENSVVVAVVDPGVGSQRYPLIVQRQGMTLVGPDNGLLSQCILPGARAKRILWRPLHLSSSFHGRDLFGPIAGMLAEGESVESVDCAGSELVGADWPQEIAEIVYVDHYGNLMTGMDAASIPVSRKLSLAGQLISHATTFSDVTPGTGFWYENSLGLLEIAINQGRANEVFKAAIGDAFGLQ